MCFAEHASPSKRHKQHLGFLVRQRWHWVGTIQTIWLLHSLSVRVNDGRRQAFVEAFVTAPPPLARHSLLYSTRQHNDKPKQRRFKTRPNRKNLQSTPSPPSQSMESRASPMLDYQLQRNENVNKERLIEPINCEHFKSCSGCVVNRNVADVPVVTSARRFFGALRDDWWWREERRRRRGRPSKQDDAVNTETFPVVIPSPVRAWRTQAKLAVAPKSNSRWSFDGLVFGLYERGSHHVLPIPQCAVHHPVINQAVRALESATAKTKTPVYDEQQSNDGLRYVQLQVEGATNTVCLTLVWHAETIKQTQPALTRLIKELQAIDPKLWHSIWCNCNDSAGNAIVHRSPQRWHRLYGPEFVREPLGGEQHGGWLYFTPSSFRQSNMDGFDVLAQDVARAVPASAKVCELYAGVGVLGLMALSHHHECATPLAWLRCSDENPSNPRSFHRSVDSLPVAMTGRRPAGRRSSKASRAASPGITLAQLAEMMESADAPRLSRQSSIGDRTSYLVASAGRALLDGQALGANVMIVDPPRKGLDEFVVDELGKPHNPNQPYAEDATLLDMPDDKVNWCNDVATLVYVSCGFDALARDCEQLLSGQGGWKLESATGYILFPGSDHVETLAIFRRKVGR